MTPVRHVRDAAATGRTVLGTVVFEFASAAVPALARDCGADFLLIDMEHTPFDASTVRLLVQTCNYEDVAPIVRVPSLVDLQLVGKVLDFGAAGVMAPMVASRRDAEQLVAATRYPPTGVRGAGYVRQAAWRTDEAERRECAPLVVAQIESMDGLVNVDAIASVDGIDVLWVGQRDLSVALGVPGRFESEPFVDAVRRVGEAATDAGKLAGYVVEAPEQAEALMPYGYRCLAISSDVALYGSALQTRLDRVRNLVAPVSLRGMASS